MKTTIEDVARLAGVSITTVSRVLNDNYPVHAKTKAKVMEAMEELEYSPNSLARGLIQKRTNTVGILVPSITNLFFPEVVNGIQDTLDAKGYSVMLCDTSGDAAREQTHVRILMERRVDGIISIDPRTENIPRYEKISRSLPTVLINGYNEGINCHFVLNDQKAGAVDAMRYFISLGHRRIGFIRGAKSYSYDLKEEVYRAVLQEQGVEVDERNVIRMEKGNSIQTMDLAREAVAKRLASSDRPTALFACNDWMAVGALYAAQTLGISVPESLSVIGYDNIVISEMTMPKLTTVDQNMQKLGRVTAERLCSIMNGDSCPPGKIYIENTLVQRESCGAL